MQNITVEISAKGYTGLTAENIEKALCHYFGSPTLRVSFSVTEAVQRGVQPTLLKCPHCNLPLIEGACPDLYRLIESLRR